MGGPFFPNLALALAFSGVLIALLTRAAWTDWKTLKVPKPLTVGLMAGGLALNTVRGVWLAADGHPVWAFDADHPLLGGIDGLLFGAAGFALGFALFFVLWIFGVCGGGDVKLVGATGAWLGPRYVLGAVVISVPLLLLLAVLVLAGRVLGGRVPTASVPVPGGPGRRSIMTFGLPFAVAAGIIAVLLVVGYVSPVRGPTP